MVHAKGGETRENHSKVTEDTEGILWVKLQPVQVERVSVVCGLDFVIKVGEDINVRFDGQLLLPCSL